MDKIKLEHAYQLLDNGFSLLTAHENKKPNFPWKPQQKKIISKQLFKERYGAKSSKVVGIITGYDDLECIDIDLKVLDNAKDRKQFWVEYLTLLDDNIEDFYKKVVIYKTVNNGYHILYKNKNVKGNLKLAKLKGHQQAIIETRGIGGYVVVYSESFKDRTYFDIDYISDSDRDIIMQLSRMYDYKEEKNIVVNRFNKTANSKQPYKDYNEKTNILDIVSSEFSIVGETSISTLIKRNGAKSSHSGYIYKDSGCMYLFSSGTIYPHEQLITPFSAITYRDYNGDFSKANGALYHLGYGDRKEPKTIQPKIEFSTNDLDFPIDIFPKEIQDYLLQCNSTLNTSVEYMGNTLVWLLSTVIGNTIKVKVKNGWEESGIVWISLVGETGIGKSPSIKIVRFPISNLNEERAEEYMKAKEEYDKYKHFTAEDRKGEIEIKKPLKNQFIVIDITMEALVDLHSDNKNGVGVLKDELSGWIKDMNKYRAGSDKEFWLSSFNNDSYMLNRKTSKDGFVKNLYIPVLGGIQPKILTEFNTDENKASGFTDRILLCFPELEVEFYSELELSETTLSWYENYMVGFFDFIKDSGRNDNTIIANWAPDAKKEWIRIFNKITAQQRSDNENEYLKSMLPKQKTYVPRFALLLNTFLAYSDREKYKLNVIHKDAVLYAEKLSNYFIAMAKKVKNDTDETETMETIIESMYSESNGKIIREIKNSLPNANKTKLAELLGVNRSTIHRHW